MTSNIIELFKEKGVDFKKIPPVYKEEDYKLEIRAKHNITDTHFKNSTEKEDTITQAIKIKIKQELCNFYNGYDRHCLMSRIQIKKPEYSSELNNTYRNKKEKTAELLVAEKALAENAGNKERKTTVDRLYKELKNIQDEIDVTEKKPWKYYSCSVCSRIYSNDDWRYICVAPYDLNWCLQEDRYKDAKELEKYIAPGKDKHCVENDFPKKNYNGKNIEINFDYLDNQDKTGADTRFSGDVKTLASTLCASLNSLSNGQTPKVVETTQGDLCCKYSECEECFMRWKYQWDEYNKKNSQYYLFSRIGTEAKKDGDGSFFHGIADGGKYYFFKKKSESDAINPVYETYDDVKYCSNRKATETEAKFECLGHTFQNISPLTIDDANKQWKTKTLDILEKVKSAADAFKKTYLKSFEIFSAKLENINDYRVGKGEGRFEFLIPIIDSFKRASADIKSALDSVNTEKINKKIGDSKIILTEYLTPLLEKPFGEYKYVPIVLIRNKLGSDNYTDLPGLKKKPRCWSLKVICTQVRGLANKKYNNEFKRKVADGLLVFSEIVALAEEFVAVQNNELPSYIAWREAFGAEQDHAIGFQALMGFLMLHSDEEVPIQPLIVHDLKKTVIFEKPADKGPSEISDETLENMLESTIGKYYSYYNDHNSEDESITANSIKTYVVDLKEKLNIDISKFGRKWKQWVDKQMENFDKLDNHTDVQWENISLDTISLANDSTEPTIKITKLRCKKINISEAFPDKGQVYNLMSYSAECVIEFERGKAKIAISVSGVRRNSDNLVAQTKEACEEYFKFLKNGKFYSELAKTANPLLKINKSYEDPTKEHTDYIKILEEVFEGKRINGTKWYPDISGFLPSKSSTINVTSRPVLHPKIENIPYLKTAFSQENENNPNVKDGVAIYIIFSTPNGNSGHANLLIWHNGIFYGLGGASGSGLYNPVLKDSNGTYHLKKSQSSGESDFLIQSPDIYQVCPSSFFYKDIRVSEPFGRVNEKKKNLYSFVGKVLRKTEIQMKLGKKLGIDRHYILTAGILNKTHIVNLKRVILSQTYDTINKVKFFLSPNYLSTGILLNVFTMQFPYKVGSAYPEGTDLSKISANCVTLLELIFKDLMCSREVPLIGEQGAPPIVNNAKMADKLGSLLIGTCNNPITHEKIHDLIKWLDKNINVNIKSASVTHSTQGGSRRGGKYRLTRSKITRRYKLPL